MNQEKKAKSDNKKEKPDTDKQAPPKSQWRDWISILAQVGSMVATIVALCALHETRIQRENMSRPDLFYGDVEFYADNSIPGDIRLFMKEKDSLSVLERPWCRINNVGLGCALSVHTHILFNSKTITDYLTKYGLEYRMVDNDPYMEYIIHQKDSLFFFKTSVLANSKVDYVLPLSQSNEVSVQYLSEIAIFNIIIAYSWLKKEYPNVEIDPFEIPLEVAYKDINDKMYKKRFVMRVFCEMSKENLVKCSINTGLSISDTINELNEAYPLSFWSKK